MAFRILAIVFVLLCVAVSVIADEAGECTFKLIFIPADMKGQIVDEIKDKPDCVYVHSLPYLADTDVEEVDVLRSANVRGRLLVSFIFNIEGKKKLTTLVKTYGTKRIAIYSDGKLITKVSIVPPSFMGNRIVISWPGTEKELRSFAQKAGHEQPDMLTLYIEETQKYHDTASEAWASAYDNVAKYIQSKNRQYYIDRMIAESLREE